MDSELANDHDAEPPAGRYAPIPAPVRREADPGGPRGVWDEEGNLRSEFIEAGEPQALDLHEWFVFGLLIVSFGMLGWLGGWILYLVSEIGMALIRTPPPGSQRAEQVVLSLIAFLEDPMRMWWAGAVGGSLGAWRGTRFVMKAWFHTGEPD